jgi:hypothetical protein
MSFEEEVREQLEAKIGLEIPSQVWIYFVREGKIAAVLRREKSIDKLADEFWAFAKASGLERKLLAVPTMLTAQQRQRAADHQTVLAILLAQEAASEPAVVDFRGRILAGGLLTTDAVEAWLGKQAATDGRPTVWLQDVVVPAGYELRRIPGRWAVFPKPRLTLSREHSGRASTRLLACVLPGGRIVSFQTKAGGVMEELRALSQRLARQFSWSSMQATLFILTGEIPAVPLIQVSTEYSSRRPGCTRITLEVDPTASPRLVAERYRQTRSEVFTRRIKALTLKHLRLAVFTAEHTAAGSWQSLCKEWNRKYAEWKYGHQKNFKRDCLRARMRLLTLNQETSGSVVAPLPDLSLGRKAGNKVSSRSRQKKRTR